MASNPPPSSTNGHTHPSQAEQDTQLTCDVLCSLGASTQAPSTVSTTRTTTVVAMANTSSSANSCTRGGKSAALANCPKSHQLPLFLSKTYHMIDRCEPTIATWSIDGSNFVVKHVEQFASGVLPLYFKHSNFSSFARQLNFYGFRKLRTDPILTSDVDPRTACYVRFYHEKFQKDRPELLHQIKRATKSDQQSKDDVESLKQEVGKLKEAMGQLRDDTDRRLAEMSYECNRRITSMGAEYDKLAGVVQQLIHQNNPAVGAAVAAPPGMPPAAAGLPVALGHNPHAAAIAAAAAVAAGVQSAPHMSTAPVPGTMPALAPTQGQAPVTAAPGPMTQPTLATATQVPAPAHVPAPAQADTQAAVPPSRMPDLMHSLSQAAAMSLQQQQQQAADTTNGTKRPAEGEAVGAPLSKQPPQPQPPQPPQEQQPRPLP